MLAGIIGAEAARGRSSIRASYRPPGHSRAVNEITTMSFTENSPQSVDPPQRPARGSSTMSVQQAADVMGVHVNTVRALIRRGELTPLPRATSGRGSADLELDAAAVRRLKRARDRESDLAHFGRTARERAAYLRGYNARRRQSTVDEGPARNSSTTTGAAAAASRRGRRS